VVQPWAKHHHDDSSKDEDVSVVQMLLLEVCCVCNEIKPRTMNGRKETIA
jgi:hypothetical protein